MSMAATRLLTLVLAVFCGWSLLVLLVVHAGLGERYSLHPEDAAQVTVPPSLRLNRAQSALGSLDSYAVIGERPLFNSNRRPLPPMGSDAAPVVAVAAAPLDVLLTSVVLRGDTQIAQFTDKRSGTSQSLKIGQALAGEQSAWRLVELAPRGAVFEGPSGRVDVELRVFDGQGGEPPTAPPVVNQDVAASNAQAGAEAGQQAGQQRSGAEAGADGQTPESRAEMIRRRIEERRRQMREEAARAAENKTQ